MAKFSQPGLTIPTAAPTAPPAPELIHVASRRVKCDGGGALGHPLVYYDIGEKDYAECGYCNRRFVLADGAGGH